MAKKRVVVKLLGEAKQAYLDLKKRVQRERDKCITSSFDQTLLHAIDSKLAVLKTNCAYGDQVPRSLIPKKYLEQYEVNNLWRVDLAGYWRLVYTLKQPLRGPKEVEILSIWLDVLDIVPHERYDKIFGYRKK
ncbi:Uncharacterised protein [uncultured archaeon]|nr:Uncharacterised protein [uncultured archaeon]